MPIDKIVGKKLLLFQKTVSVAESCTGGLVSHLLTNTPGSSSYYQGGLVAYSNEVKQKFLKIPSPLLKKYGAVSESVASRMAENARKIFQTDFGIGLSGIAGPAGGTKTKPVGLVFIAVSTKSETICLKCRFKGSRLTVKKQAARQALQLLSEFL